MNSLLLIAAGLAGPLVQDSGEAAKRSDGPWTTAESSGYTRTSTSEDVQAFLAALDELPQGSRLHRSVFGKTNEGRELVLVAVSDRDLESEAALLASGKLRLLVNANIHAGEVEGKEAVQMILRELANGQHAELLEHAVLFFVPVYNADGNDRIARENRVSQNGPDGGVGERPNAQGLDLNRDFIKVESPECAAMTGLFRRLDPHLFMDLHTTNGSAHGYHLTYAPSLSPNVDPELDRFARESFLPALRSALAKDHGFRVFDYGNFSRRESRRWSTYDHRPRFGTNYYGLRNRLALLSEAYSYVAFEDRVAVTRAFVLEALRFCVRERARIKDLCAAADQRAAAGAPPLIFGFDAELVPGREDEVLVGSVETVEVDLGERKGQRRVVQPEFHAERMLVQDAFRATATLELPAAWALVDPAPAIVERLRAHGLSFKRLASPSDVRVRAFEPTALERARRPFQGHNEVQLEGTWSEVTRALPRGTLVVPAGQRLARVAAQLLEPECDDSLSTWNFFEEGTSVKTDGRPGTYPVLRLPTLAGLELTDGD